MLKQIIKSVLRFLATPWRAVRHQRDGVCDSAERHEIPNEVLLGLVREYLQEGHTGQIWVKGYSMRPFLEHMRDQVKLVPVKRPLEVGDAILAEITKGHYVLHRIIDIKGEHITLMGDGNVRGTESCTTKDVVGIVTEYIRPKRTLLASDKGLIRRIKIWRKLLPIRRYLLVFYKASI